MEITYVNKKKITGRPETNDRRGRQNLNGVANSSTLIEYSGVCPIKPFIQIPGIPWVCAIPGVEILVKL